MEKIEVRLDAIKTIALFGPQAKKAVPALRHAMKDEDHRIRAVAAEALGKMELDGADAVPELLVVLADKKLDVHARPSLLWYCSPPPVSPISCKKYGRPIVKDTGWHPWP